MSTGARMWRVDPREVRRELEGELREARRASIAPGTREIDLDRSWEAIGALLDAIGADNLFEQGELRARDVQKLAKKLGPLPWPKARETFAFLARSGDAELYDPEYLEAYWSAFREAILDAARERRDVVCELA